MDFLFNGLAGLVAFFYSLTHDYASAIILLTVTVMLVLAPLTWKGTRSMLAMQRLQPEIKKLQAKHKNDRQALNEAMMAFYKEHQVNPVAGCLPQLLQFPVLIVMFNVIRGLTKTVDGHAAPKYISHATDLYSALREAGGHMISVGMDLSRTAAQSKGSDAIPLYILIGLVVASSFWQSRQMTARNPAASTNSQMQIMQRVFPVISGVISLNLPAGVVLYFLVSNLFRIGQQALMYRLDPTLNAEVKKEVKEIDVKADEIERRHQTDGGSRPANGSAPASRVTTNGARGNGARQPGRPNSRKARKRRSRKR
ncbi:MAG TPA: YidC/Oxa1 family membrane protein insertase [Acidimicrobiales bacterium]|nr:YidC/Oxa1 family membrane protein insertase [Acidimicrobiales bacterium]